MDAAERERTLSTLVDQMQEAVLVLDRELRIETWAGAAEAVFGWTAEEAVGQRVVDLFDPKPVGCDIDAVKKRMREAEPACLVAYDLRKDGTRRANHITFEPLRDGDRRPTGSTLVVIRDHTEQLRAQREQALLAGLIREMYDAVIVIDLEFRVLTYTASARRLLGWDESEVLGQDARTFFTFELCEGDRAEFGERLRSGQHCRVSIRAQRRGGSWIDLDVVADVLRDASGQVTGYFLVARDMTILKEAARALQESEQRLSLALAGSREGLWDIHVPTGMALFSGRTREMLGLGTDDALMHVSAWLELVHPDERPAVHVAITGFMTGCDPDIDLEYRLADREGREVYLHARGRVVEWDGDGHPQRAAGTVTDITARRVAERQLKVALRENERLVEELREALDNVKTLSGLLPICAWCKKVRSDTGFWEQVEEYLMQHSDAEIRHGICPDCFNRHTPRRKLGGE